MAKVTFYPRMRCARIEDDHLKAWLTVFDYDWTVSIHRVLRALNYERVTPWEQSGQNYIAEFNNDHMDQTLLLFPGHRKLAS
jgi:hypothetical protein